MAADLGTWPAEQATVLLEVLHNHGLHPDARRGRDGVHVTVPDEEGDRAHATLVAQMDTIAQAARPASAHRGRRLRAVESPEPRRRSARRGPSPSRPAKRPAKRPADGRSITWLSSPFVIAAAGFTLAFVAAAGGASPVFPLTVMTGALIWVLGKRAERGL